VYAYISKNGKALKDVFLHTNGKEKEERGMETEEIFRFTNAMQNLRFSFPPRSLKHKKQFIAGTITKNCGKPPQKRGKYRKA
jgi:hypothetical protein